MSKGGLKFFDTLILIRNFLRNYRSVTILDFRILWEGLSKGQDDSCISATLVLTKKASDISYNRFVPIKEISKAAMEVAGAL